MNYFSYYQNLIAIKGKKRTFRLGVSYITGIPLTELVAWERSRQVPAAYVGLLQRHEAQILARKSQAEAYVKIVAGAA